MPWMLVLAGIAIGMLLPIQPGLNAQLRVHGGSALLASLVSFAIGTGALALVLLFARPPSGAMARMADAPWWAWLGGLIGAVFVTVSIVLAPKLGAVLLVGAVLTGQLLSSVVIDHFGLAGYETARITPGRIVGVALLFVGVVLIQRSTAVGEPPILGPGAPTAGDVTTEPPAGR